MASQTGADILSYKDSVFNSGIDANFLYRKVVPFQAHIRSYYFFQNFESGEKREASVIGGELSWHPTIVKDVLTANAALVTSQKIYAPEDRDGTLLLAPNQESYTALSEYSLRFMKDWLVINVGARKYNSPIISTSDARQSPITHRGIDINYRIDANNYVGIAVLEGIKFLNSNKFVHLYELAASTAAVLASVPARRRRVAWSTSRIALFTTMPPSMMIPM